MAMNPYPFQRKDLDTLRANNYTSLLNMQPGSGKTPTATWAIQESGSTHTLIVAPLNTHKNAWGKTIQEILGREARVVGNGNKAQRQAMFDLEFGYPGEYLITPNLLTRIHSANRDWISSLSLNLAIVDEAHMLSKPKSKGQQAYELLGSRAGGRMSLSGTPAMRSFERNWSHMRFLWPHLYERGEVAYDNFYVWCQDRMDFEEVYTSQRDHFGNPKKVKNWMHEKQSGLLFSQAPCVLQHFRREACCEFHPNGFLTMEAPQVIDRYVPLLPEQKRAAKSLEDSFMAWLDGNPLVVDLAITQKQRLRQVTLGVPTVEEFTIMEWNEETQEDEEVIKQTLQFEPDCKSPFADEVLDILGNLDDGEPVVVYLESQRFAEVLTGKLNKAGYSAAEFSGQTVKVREGYLQEFGKSIQVLVAVISAAGTGTDGLQEVSNTEIWIERSVNDTANEQAEARQDRLGAKAQVQRFVIHDDLGYADGQMSAQLDKRLKIQASTRKVV